MRKTRWSRAAAAVAALQLLSGCAGSKAAEQTTEQMTEKGTESASETRVITDHAGNEVVLPEKIERIAVTDTLPLPSVLSLYLGSAEKLVGISPVSMSAAKAGLLGELYPEILQADTSFFENSELNTESLLKLEPDLVFYNAGSKELGEAITSAGMTAAAVSVTNWDYNAKDTFDAWMELLSEIFPEEQEKADRAREYSAGMEKRISEKTAGLTEEERKKVFFLFQYSDTTLVTSGKNFWGQYWCDVIGAVNAAEEIEAERSSAVVNMEQIYSWDPQVIFISNFTKTMPKDLYENTIGSDDWSEICAVREKQVYKMPLGAYRSFTPGADTPVTMLWLAKTVYPELFADVDMTKEVQDYYQAVYGISLTPEQVAAMYEPPAEAADGYGNKQ